MSSCACVGGHRGSDGFWVEVRGMCFIMSQPASGVPAERDKVKRSVSSLSSLRIVHGHVRGVRMVVTFLFKLRFVAMEPYQSVRNYINPGFCLLDGS